MAKTGSGRGIIKSSSKGSDKPDLASRARAAVATEQVAHGPSPNPMTNLLLTDIALRGAGILMRQTIERGVLGTKVGPATARDIVKGRSLTQTMVSTMLARVATRSLPGALLVGGGLVAKTLFDRSIAAKAKAEGREALAKRVKKAEE